MIAFALAALCIGGAISAQSGETTPNPSADDACLQKGGMIDDKGKCMLTIDAKISVDYPLDLAQQYPLVASTIDPFIKTAKDEYFQTVSADFSPAPGPYEEDITYETFKHSDSIFTLVFTVYEFTGGAHGYTNTTTYTFDLKNNKLLTLDDIFTNTADALAIIEPIVQATVKAAVGEMNQQDMLDAGTGTDPNNYQDFSLDGDTITFYFPPYQVAPYAAGVQKVTIPFSQLSSVLKPGMNV